MTHHINLDEEFATLLDLVRALGYEVTEEAGGNELEDYAESYISQDADVNIFDWYKHKSGESLILESEGVLMWILGFPTTVRVLHEYLDEFDRRIGRMRIIAGIPTPDDEDDDDAARKIAAAIALVFGVDAERLCDDLGTKWTSFNDDAVGSYTHPVAYVRWADHLVVGLDDQYVYVFRIGPDGSVRDAYEGGVIWEGVWSDGDGVFGYADFVRTLRKSAASAGMLPLPRRKTRTDGDDRI